MSQPCQECKAKDAELANLRQLNIDACDDDTAIRDLVRPILGELATDGTSYGVPSLVDVVGVLCREIAQLRSVVETMLSIDPYPRVIVGRYDRQVYNEGWHDAVLEIRRIHGATAQGET